MKFVNEDIQDVLKPKSEEEISQSFEDMSPSQMLKTALQHKIAKQVLIALKNGANIQSHQYEEIKRLIPDLNIEKFLKDPEQAFKVAVGLKDTKKIKATVRKAKNKDFMNGQALMVAIEKGDVPLVRILLKHIDPDKGGRLQNMYPHFNQAPIRKAAQWGEREIVNMLLKDPRVNPAVDNNWAMKAAIKHKQWDVVELLSMDDRVVKSLSTKELKTILRKLTNTIRVKNVSESLEGVLKPKSEEEIGDAMKDKYGFHPSEKTLILAQDRSPKEDRGTIGAERPKIGARLFPIEYHANVHEDGKFNTLIFYKLDPEKKWNTLSKLSENERYWLIRVIDGDIPFGKGWEKGPGFETTKKWIEAFRNIK